MIEYHCLTSSFSHTDGSCAELKPKNKWVYSLPTDLNTPLVLVDNYIPSVESLPNFNKFGWLAESSFIVDGACQWVKENIELVEKSFLKVFVNDMSFLDMSDIFEYVPPGSNMPWVKEYYIRPKTKIVSIIASAKNWTVGHRIRHEIVKNDPSVDAYGGGYKRVERKEEALNDYMFSYCIENAKYDLYYTEKLTDCIATGTIPIYWGSDKISEVFNADGFIRYDDINGIELNEDLYQSMLGYAEENLKILQSMECSDNTVQNRIRELVQ